MQLSRHWLRILGSNWSLALAMNATRVSESVRRDIAAALQLPETNIRILHLAVGSLVVDFEVSRNSSQRMPDELINSLLLTNARLTSLSAAYAALTGSTEIISVDDAITTASSEAAGDGTLNSPCGAMCKAGIAAGLGLATLIAGTTGILCYRRFKRRRKEDPEYLAAKRAAFENVAPPTADSVSHRRTGEEGTHFLNKNSNEPTNSDVAASRPILPPLHKVFAPPESSREETVESKKPKKKKKTTNETNKKSSSSKGSHKDVSSTPAGQNGDIGTRPVTPPTARARWYTSTGDPNVRTLTVDSLHFEYHDSETSTPPAAAANTTARQDVVASSPQDVDDASKPTSARTESGPLVTPGGMSLSTPTGTDAVLGRRDAAVTDSTDEPLHRDDVAVVIHGDGGTGTIDKDAAGPPHRDQSRRTSASSWLQLKALGAAAARFLRSKKKDTPPPMPPVAAGEEHPHQRANPLHTAPPTFSRHEPTASNFDDVVVMEDVFQVERPSADVEGGAPPVLRGSSSSHAQLVLAAATRRAILPPSVAGAPLLRVPPPTSAPVRNALLSFFDDDVTAAKQQQRDDGADDCYVVEKAPVYEGEDDTQSVESGDGSSSSEREVARTLSRASSYEYEYEYADSQGRGSSEEADKQQPYQATFRSAGGGGRVCLTQLTSMRMPPPPLSRPRTSVTASQQSRGSSEEESDGQDWEWEVVEEAEPTADRPSHTVVQMPSRSSYAAIGGEEPESRPPSEYDEDDTPR